MRPLREGDVVTKQIEFFVIFLSPRNYRGSKGVERCPYQRLWFLSYGDGLLFFPSRTLSKNAILFVFLSCKNWLFAGVLKGAYSKAVLFSLVETAKANEIDPQAYLKFLCERFPAAQTAEDMRALMPQYVDKSVLPKPL